MLIVNGNSLVLKDFDQILKGDFHLILQISDIIFARRPLFIALVPPFHAKKFPEQRRRHCSITGLSGKQLHHAHGRTNKKRNQSFNIQPLESLLGFEIAGFRKEIAPAADENLHAVEKLHARKILALIIHGEFFRFG